MATDETPPTVRPDVALIRPGSGWRVAFSQGFLDGDSDRMLADARWGYVVGWKLGGVFRRLRVRAS